MAFTQEPLEMFQSLMCLSAVPPPDASITGFHGHQAKAYTQSKLYYSLSVTIISILHPFLFVLNKHEL